MKSYFRMIYVFMILFILMSMKIEQEYSQVRTKNNPVNLGHFHIITFRVEYEMIF